MGALVRRVRICLHAKGIWLALLERFDLVMRQRDYFMKGPQALFEFVRQAGFRDRASEFGGYDVGEAGAVRLVN